MKTWDSQRFVAGAAEAGTSQETLVNALAAAGRIQQAAPWAEVVFTLAHLAQFSEVPYKYIRSVASRSEAIDPYRVFALKRATQDTPRPPRVICAPEPMLMRTQRWINSHILAGAPVHHSSVAYAKDCHIAKAAKQHCQASWLIKLDVSNFFESILEPKVYKVFAGFGYQPLLAFELARICTRLRPKGNVGRDTAGWSIDAYRTGRLGHLPQGAPTSPMLANLCCLEFDEQIAQIAQRHGMRYTRYADDLALSTTSHSFNRRKASQVVGECYEVMNSHSLWPNRTKTRVVPPGSRKVVLGLLVDSRSPALPKEFRNRLQVHLHYLRKKGPELHARDWGFDSVYGLQNHLFGLAAFAIGIDPAWGRETMRELKALPWPAPFEMPL